MNISRTSFHRSVIQILLAKCIWLEVDSPEVENKSVFEKVLGSMLVFEQLHRYPSPNPTLILNWLSVNCCCVNPLTPECDHHLISPYNIIPKWYIEVTRKKEMITINRSSRLLNKFSLSAPWKCIEYSMESMSTGVRV